MTYSVLALDQSMKNTGWAHLVKGELPTAGAFSLPSWGDEEGLYLVRFEKWLTDMVVGRKVTNLMFENTYVRLPYREPLNVLVAQYGLISVMLMVAFKMSVPALMVGPSTWRKSFLGVTGAPASIQDREERTAWLKRRALREAERRYGMVMDDHNAAEALGILHFGVCSIDPDYAGRTDPIFRRAG